MNRTAVVVIGAGQAGLAVSRLLNDATVDHVVLDRGRVAESWRSRRPDSLRLLTPNWMTRLPGWRYRGADPEGFMAATEVADFLSAYAASFGAPVVPHADVTSVSHDGAHFVVRTSVGTWRSDAVVVASGYNDKPRIPGMATKIHPSVRQISADAYRSPKDLADGGVLVVGASASGVQIAGELAVDGRTVLLAVGRHVRVPRRYRGMDIMWWLDAIGALNRPVESADSSVRFEPSLQLAGAPTAAPTDLPGLVTRGIHLAGHLLDVDQGVATFADDLVTSTGEADERLGRLLSRIDRYASRAGLDAELDPRWRPDSSSDPEQLRPAAVNLARNGIRTVVWATGYQRRYPWLQLPVLDEAGEIVHQAERTALPGLVVVGMGWQTRRNSAFIDGVGHDAAMVVEHLTGTVLATAHEGRAAA